MKKAAFILGGFKLEINPDDQLYVDYSELFAELGYEPMVPNLDWRRKNHSTYLKEFTKYYEENKLENNLIIGNSFGAAIAYMGAPQLKPDNLLLCSLSPFFKEDIGNFSESRAISHFGNFRVKDFNSYSAHDIASKIESDTVFFFGSKERGGMQHLVDRVIDSHEHMPSSKLVEIVGAGHRMREEEYLNGVSKWCDENIETADDY